LKDCKQKTKDVTLHYKLKALLGRCEELSKERHKLLHGVWAIGADGSLLTKGSRHAWGKAPSADDLNQLGSDISEYVGKLNGARLQGYIRDVCNAVEG
jgi:hypothetical protein